MSEDNILWVDFETTGLLDEEGVAPLELAAVVTDKDLNELGFLGPLDIHAEPESLALMGDFVRAMHAGSGVVERSQASIRDIRTADTILSIFAEQYLPFKGGAEYRGWVIAGSSVKFDFEVIERFFPQTRAQMDYRVIDVSSVGELVRRWDPEGWGARPEKKREHSALADVRESIEELRYYRSIGMGAGRG